MSVASLDIRCVFFSGFGPSMAIGYLIYRLGSSSIWLLRTLIPFTAWNQNDEGSIYPRP